MHKRAISTKKSAKKSGQLTDNGLISQSLSLTRAAGQIFNQALPNTKPELIGGFFADLLNLWETGQKLDRELLRLKELQSPQDKEQLREFLIWVSAIQIDMASYWIAELKKDLPKLLRALDRIG